MILSIETPKWALPFVAKDSQDARYLCAYGGRGSGKSWFFADLLIERCLAKKTDVVCIREVQKSLEQSVKKLIESRIHALGVSSHFTILNNVIKVNNDGRIIFQGMQDHTAESIKSLEGFDIAWVEEAQTLKLKSLMMLRPTIRKEGSQIWFGWNPRHETDPVDAFFRCENPPTNAIVIKVNYSDNPFFPEVLKQEMLYDKERDFDKYLHVWEGEYVTYSDALVFKNWVVNEFDTPRNTVFRFGADWGFANDPTVLIRCYIEGRQLYIDYEAYRVGCEIVDTPELFMSVPDSEKYPIVADSSRPETISHMRKNGFHRIIGAAKGAGSVEDGVEWLKSFNIIVHPRCKHTIDELKSYRYKQDDTDNILPVFVDKNNHVIDALRYACESARRLDHQKQRENKHTANYHVMPSRNLGAV